MKSLCYCFLWLVLFSSLHAENELYPLLYPGNEFALPGKFRTSQDPYKQGSQCTVSRKGLDKLRVSASEQPSEKGFQYLVSILPDKNLIFVDLRRECHGFLNGNYVRWKLEHPLDQTRASDYNYDLNSYQIDEKEKSFLEKQITNEVGEYKTKDGLFINFLVTSVLTEKELVEKMGYQYIRFPVMDAQYPQDVQIDDFIAFVKDLPEDYWLHFHCAEGKGRTTTFICLLDMMKNHEALSADDIMIRHAALGGLNLIDPENHYADHPEQIGRGIERRESLRLFHRYCVENPNFEEAWSSWKAAKLH